MKGVRAFFAVLAVIIVMVSIGILCLTSRLSGLVRIFGSDKVAHALAYGVFACVLAYSLTIITDISVGRAILWALLLSCSFGALCEGVQYFLPYRHADWYDIWANVIGASMGSFIFWFFKIVMG